MAPFCEISLSLNDEHNIRQVEGSIFNMFQDEVLNLQQCYIVLVNYFHCTKYRRYPVLGTSLFLVQCKKIGLRISLPSLP